MSALLQHLTEPGWFSLREVLRLLLLSGLFTLACVMAFPRNAPTRRALLLAAVVALIILPWLLASVDAIWYVAFTAPPLWTLGTAVPNVLLWIWGGVASLLIISHLRLVRRQIAGIAQFDSLDDPRAQSLLMELSQRLGLNAPDLKLGDCACSTSLGRSILVLPPEWRDWSDATLRSVFAHELVHIQRRDDRWLLVTRLLVLFYWWMPWLIWLYRVYVRAMEESCDDAASEVIGHELSYVGALVNAAGIAVEDDKSDCYVTNMHQHHLVGRVGRFAEIRVLELNTRGLYWCVLGILLVVVALTGIEPVLKVPSLSVEPRSYSALESTSTAGPAAVSATFPRVYQNIQAPNGGMSERLRLRLSQPRSQARPIYPGNAIRQNIEGDVIVEATIAADGSVVNTGIIRSEPPGVFDQAALRALSKTRYRPAYTTTRLADVARRTSPQTQSVQIRHHFYFRIEAP